MNFYTTAREKYPAECEWFESWVNEYMGQPVDYAKLPKDLQQYIWIEFEMDPSGLRTMHQVIENAFAEKAKKN
jgi:hypothetical protein